MEDALKWTTNQTHLKAVNNCCIYLQVVHWSDITNATGDALQTGAYNSNMAIDSISAHLWPCQKLPGDRAWKIWQKFLATKCNTGRHLTTCLGASHYASDTKYTRKWTYIYYPQENIVQDLEGNTIKLRKSCCTWYGDSSAEDVP